MKEDPNHSGMLPGHVAEDFQDMKVEVGWRNNCNCLKLFCYRKMKTKSPPHIRGPEDDRHPPQLSSFNRAAPKLA
jgi:hypothetical protein